MKNAKTYLVTGSAGFIGSHTVDALLEQGYKVVGVDNLSTGFMSNLEMALNNDRFTFIEADVTNAFNMYDVFGTPFDGVYHAAALVSVPQSIEEPQRNAEINLFATDRIARLCVEFDVSTFVFASSAAVYGGFEIAQPLSELSTYPTSPYGAAKMASEVMLLGYMKTYGLSVVSFRYFNVYGPRQSVSNPYSGVLALFTDCAKNDLPPTIFGDGEQSRDFISVKDVARFNVQALTDPEFICGTYNVCTGVSTSLNQVVEIMKEIYPAASSPIYKESRMGDQKHSLGDPSLLNKVMGLEATVKFKDGFTRLLTG